MQIAPLVFGLFVSGGVAAAHVYESLRLRRATFCSGIVNGIRETTEKGPDYSDWRPSICYVFDGAERQFESTWGAGDKLWSVGDHVTVAIVDGEPSLYEPEFQRGLTLAWLLFGGLFIWAAFR